MSSLAPHVQAFLGRVDDRTVGGIDAHARGIAPPTDGAPASPLLTPTCAPTAHCLTSTLRSHPAAFMLPDVDMRRLAPGSRVRDARPARFRAERGHAGARERRVDLRRRSTNVSRSAMASASQAPEHSRGVDPSSAWPGSDRASR